MKAIKRISFVFVLVTLAGRSGATMIPHYSTYTNVVYNTNGTATFTATLQGSSTSSTGSCPGLNDYFYHDAAVNVNSSGNSSVVAPCAYVNLSQSVVLSNACLTNGTGCPVNWNASIYCSLLPGYIFGPGYFNFTIRLTQTYWGPPPIKQGDSCIYNVLACSTGIPTCTSATPALSFTLGCPSYVKAEYLVINGTCDFALVTSANGPGVCN